MKGCLYENNKLLWKYQRSKAWLKTLVSIATASLLLVACGKSTNDDASGATTRSLYTANKNASYNGFFLSTLIFEDNQLSKEKAVVGINGNLRESITDLVPTEQPL